MNALAFFLLILLGVQNAFAAYKQAYDGNMIPFILHVATIVLAVIASLCLLS